MTDYSQITFVTNWNKTANYLQAARYASHLKRTGYNKLPKLNDGIFTGGVCTGLSWALDEYVKMDDEPKFYELYNLVVCTSSKKLAHALLLHSEILDLSRKSKKLAKLPKNNNIIEKINKKLIKKNTLKKELFPNLSSNDFQELIDFIYKIYILQDKQKINQIDIGPETSNEIWLRNAALSANHLRIGSKLIQERINKDVGEVSNKEEYNNLPYVISSLAPNEPLDIGIYDNKANIAHNVTIYKRKNQFHVFDPNVGKKVTVNTPKEAANELIYCVNQNMTKGTNKFTTFDRLWHESELFKVFAVICFPITLPWLIYDEFFAKPVSVEKLKAKPLVNTTWLSWGRVKPVPASMPPNENSDLSKKVYPYANEITKDEWLMINRRYVQMKDNRYFGLSWLTSNKQTDVIRKLGNLSKIERFKFAKEYVNQNPETTFTKAIKEAIPALNKK